MIDLETRVWRAMVDQASRDAVTQQMLDSSTWVKQAGGWRCVLHTETPLVAGAAA